MFVPILALLAALASPAQTVPVQPIVIETSAVTLRGTEDVKFFRPQVSDEVEDVSRAERTLCSGVVIGRTASNDVVILTARHCFMPSPVAFLGFVVGEELPHPDAVDFKDGDSGAITSVVLFTDNDLAEVTASPLRAHTVVPLAATPPYRGTPLVVFGDNGDIPWVWSSATAASGADTYPLTVGLTHYRYSVLDCASCNHGDSGAGIFEGAATAHPRLVGILSNGNGQGLIGYTSITPTLLARYPKTAPSTLAQLLATALDVFKADETHSTAPPPLLGGAH
ncbi:MAG: trypsin-like peptidase domain-containing protein [Vulcanimicrobiaceae bacterium]